MFPMFRSALVASVATLCFTAPAAAQECVTGNTPQAVVEGVLHVAYTETVYREMAGDKFGGRWDYERHYYMIVRTDNQQSALLKFSGDIHPDGAIAIEEHGGHRVTARTGDAVRVVATFNCRQAGGADPCALSLACIQPIHH